MNAVVEPKVSEEKSSGVGRGTAAAVAVGPSPFSSNWSFGSDTRAAALLGGVATVGLLSAPAAQATVATVSTNYSNLAGVVANIQQTGGNGLQPADIGNYPGAFGFMASLGLVSRGTGQALDGMVLGVIASDLQSNGGDGVPLSQALDGVNITGWTLNATPLSGGGPTLSQSFGANPFAAISTAPAMYFDYPPAFAYLSLSTFNYTLQAGVDYSFNLYPVYAADSRYVISALVSQNNPGDVGVNEGFYYNTAQNMPDRPASQNLNFPNAVGEIHTTIVPVPEPGVMAVAALLAAGAWLRRKLKA
jgi:hypothetical protein